MKRVNPLKSTKKKFFCQKNSWALHQWIFIQILYAEHRRTTHDHTRPSFSKLSQKINEFFGKNWYDGSIANRLEVSKVQKFFIFHAVLVFFRAKKGRTKNIHGPCMEQHMAKKCLVFHETCKSIRTEKKISIKISPYRNYTWTIHGTHMAAMYGLCMMAVYDGHVWWPCMVRVWWPCMMAMYDGHVWSVCISVTIWPCMVHVYFGHVCSEYVPCVFNTWPGHVWAMYVFFRVVRSFSVCVPCIGHVSKKHTWLARNQLIGRVFFNCVVRAMRQAGIHAEWHVGAADNFIDHAVEQNSQPLPAIFGFSRETGPAAFAENFIGLFESRRGFDIAIIEGTALGIAGLIEWE